MITSRIENRFRDCTVRTTLLAFLLVLLSLTARGQEAVAVEVVDAALWGESPPAATRLTYEEHVRPIFKAMCFQCHGEEEELQGGLDVRLVRLMQAGGESGPAVVPGDIAASLLWRRIESDEMPDGPKKLSADQKSKVRHWIQQGANTARPEPENVADARFSFEELQHWSYQPVMRPPVPTPSDFRLSTPIDGFIAQRLRERDLCFSPAADRGTLIRRATYDLTGLPPTPDEVKAFVEDTSADAYPRLVERLLASPRFGIRWGRHWLDVAGYAETDGGPAGDTNRPHAWRYRDYVIDSFNENKPTDEFFVEQLAGDEMIDGPLDPQSPRHIELLTATGFLRMAPDSTQTSNTLADRNMATADTIKVVSSAMLGITVGCAQCHNHKYDPIGIDDYYRFRAIFDPAFPLRDWQQPSQRLVDLTTDEVRAKSDSIEAEASRMDQELNQRREAVGREILERKLADVPDDMREAVRAAVLTESGNRNDQQRELLDQYPMVKPVSQILGLLVEYDMPSYRKFEKEFAEIASFRETKTPLTLVMATRERPGVIPESHVYFRGDPEIPGDAVFPGEPSVLSRCGRDVRLPDNDPTLPTTGRRLAYARRLTDGTHPLTARVFVNRIWHHHMGRGLVSSTGDFGLSGERPTHPQLLDWLADDFQRHGWDAKRLHRMIMLSSTYQQRALRRPKLDTVDPENELWGRMNVRRLEAEAIRDSILAVADCLNEQSGGPSVPVTENGEGKTVIGRTKLRDGLPAGVEGENTDAFRRSVFIEVQRGLPLNVLSTFDQPDMTPNCEQRSFSTVATQSLWFLNDAAIVDSSEKLARSLFGKHDQNQEARLEYLFVKLFAAPPTPDEQLACLTFLNQNEARFRDDPDAEWQATLKRSPTEADVRAWSALCQTLLASNRFLYVD